MKDRIARIEHQLVRTETAILTVLLLAMIGFGFVQVVLRGAFSTGILWAEPLLRHLVLWVGFLGAAIAAAEGKHFAPELADRFAGRRARLAAHAIASAFALVICVFLTRASAILLRDEREAASIVMTIGEWPIPAWWLELILPLGFALLVVHYALKVLHALLDLGS